MLTNFAATGFPMSVSMVPTVFFFFFSTSVTMCSVLIKPGPLHVRLVYGGRQCCCTDVVFLVMGYEKVIVH